MKTTFVVSTATLALGFTLLAAPTGRAQTFLNSSFESPAISGFSDNNAGDNWTRTGSTGILNNDFNRGTPTPYGTQDLYVRAGTSAAQMISGFTLNTPYTLTLGAASYNSIPAATMILTLSGGATATQSYTTPASPTLGFVDYTFNFTPTTSTPVTFTIAGASANNGAFEVDNVRLGLTVVPEPSTYALALLGGLGLLGGVVRQRAARLRV